MKYTQPTFGGESEDEEVEEEEEQEAPVKKRLLRRSVWLRKERWRLINNKII